jgi:capsid protein
VDQAQLGLVVLDRILKAWLDEAILISNLLPLWLRTASLRELVHQWFWDGQEHVDPAKEASAQATRLQNHTTTLAYEYARQGRDWKNAVRQRAKEFSLMRELGLPLSGQQASPAPGSNSDQPQEEENEDAPADTEE